ncbi:MAG: hypothetical protein AB1473_18315 [Thermodesulfobacteriota bacterium]
MKIRFVVCLDDLSEQEENQITQFFQSDKTVGFWHWFVGVWFLSDPTGKWNAVKLRDALQGLIPNRNMMIVQFSGSQTWAGFGSKEMFDWMHQSWDRD